MPAAAPAALRVLLAAVFLLLGLPSAASLAQRAGEYQLKAAFLFHLTSFVEWPASSFASPDQPFRICLVGGDPFGASIRALEARRYRDRPIRIETIGRDGDLAGCQIAYFSGPAPEPFAAVARGESGLPILTVSSDDGFATSGGVIRFVSGSDRLRMEINATTARNARLRISAKLFEVASQVIDARSQGTRS